MILLLPEVKHLVDKEKYSGVFASICFCSEEDKEMIRELAELRFWNYPGLIGGCGSGRCVKVIQGLPEEDVVYALDAVVDPVSLYEPVFHEDGDALYVIDQIRDESSGEGRWLDSIALEEGIGHLNEREQRIVKLRYFQMKTQMEVSREIGISQAQVSRLEKGALERLKKYI